jgi:Icc-related predicted phosphoesterase
MKIQIMSDIHSEFHKDKGKCFVQSLDSSSVDVLILAGDVCVLRNASKNIMEFLSEKYKNSKILWVLGNHAYYNGRFEDGLRRARKIADSFNNIFLLENEIVEIKGKRFLGSTLWFEDFPTNLLHEWSFSDFKCINGFRRNVYKQNRKSIEFFRREMREGDIAITHHLPSYKCVNSFYKGSSLNCFFVCKMDSFILDKKPSHWIFGHTHSSCDLMLGNTRMIANPFGYINYDLNHKFNDNLIIDLQE